MALGHEIASLQAQAAQALDLEMAGALDAAASSYAKAASQLRYLLDVCVPRSQPDLAAVCANLLAAWTHRLRALEARGARRHPAQQEQQQQQQQPATADRVGDRPSDAPHEGGMDTAAGDGGGGSGGDSGPAAAEAQWVHLGERDAARPSLDGTASAASANTEDCGGGGPMLRFDYGAGAMYAAEPEQLPPLACWAGGACSGSPPEGASQGAAKLELLRQCQRAVSGSLDDVVGLESVKDELDEAVFMPLRHPQLFKGIRRPPRHFLLYGAPGTGKTLLVEKLAAEAGFTLLALSPSSILSKWSGDSEKALQLAFDAARAMAPAVLFLDEVDALGQARGSGAGGDDAASRRLLTELLLQMNGLGPDEGVYVFGATNRMADCDAALLRRFERRVEVPLPDRAARGEFLASMLARPEINSPLPPPDLERIVAATEGFSGSDMACLCRDAAMAPVRELFGRRDPAGGGCKRRRLGESGGAAGPGKAAGLAVRKLTAGDFEAALVKIRPAAVDAREGSAGAVPSPA
ncbi:ATPase AAA [Raphidocelis subcapitata]|uniref:ATPase AAA n=1 Tax=Raphidocelis subcapitata TaxID=307507 RepID=A0A2V0PMM8_9CHLO|nr:ATPase AAA [Raphidocelis subcapitata]|eukprot:GBF98627.1 ATPase AAA [Raphidocelis subcapitata]